MINIARVAVCVFLLPLMPAEAHAQIRGEVSLSARELEPCRTQLAQLKADVLEHYQRRAQESQGNGDDDTAQYFRGVKNELSAKDPIRLFVEGWNDDGQGFGMPEIYTDDFVSLIKEQIESPLAIITRADLNVEMFTTETWNSMQTCVIGLVQAKYDAASKLASGKGFADPGFLPRTSAKIGGSGPPRIVNVANLGTGCVRASLRNVKMDRVDPKRRVGDLVLTNSCSSEQAVRVDVDGLHIVWPAIGNIGGWAGTNNADVPAGLPFKPIIGLSETPTYLIGANSEHVASWDIPRVKDDASNELRVWIASCDSTSASGYKQVIFRPAPHFMQDARAQCAPSRIPR